jgi:hypothetical protein
MNLMVQSALHNQLLLAGIIKDANTFSGTNFFFITMLTIASHYFKKDIVLCCQDCIRVPVYVATSQRCKVVIVTSVKTNLHHSALLLHTATGFMRGEIMWARVTGKHTCELLYG